MLVLFSAQEDATAPRCLSPQPFSDVPIYKIDVYDLTCEPPVMDGYEAYYNQHGKEMEVVLEVPVIDIHYYHNTRRAKEVVLQVYIITIM